MQQATHKTNTNISGMMPPQTMKQTHKNRSTRQHSHTTGETTICIQNHQQHR